MPTRPLAVHIPDGSPFEQALARVTHLGVVAHPDDLEMLALPMIAHCRDRSDAWFGGIVCTDGAGRPTLADDASGSERSEVASIRWAEQCAAADIGRYAVVIGLGHPSADVIDDGGTGLVRELAPLLAAGGASTVVTHNPADRHRTHVAVCRATIDALRDIEADPESTKVLGIEGWGDLDWLVDDDKVRLDCSDATDLAAELVACFPSQLRHKRYDLAAEGRRRANATLAEPRADDCGTESVTGIDLSPLLGGTEDLASFTLAHIERFRGEVERRLR